MIRKIRCPNCNTEHQTTKEKVGCLSALSVFFLGLLFSSITVGVGCIIFTPVGILLMYNSIFERIPKHKCPKCKKTFRM